MPCPPSMTFLEVASRISNGGTIWPAACTSILSEPPVSLSTRSARKRKLSCSVRLAGHVDCILRVLDCASAEPAMAPARIAADANPRSAADTVSRNVIRLLPSDRGTNYLLAPFSLAGLQISPPAVYGRAYRPGTPGARCTPRHPEPLAQDWCDRPAIRCHACAIGVLAHFRSAVHPTLTVVAGHLAMRWKPAKTHESVRVLSQNMC